MRIAIAARPWVAVLRSCGAMLVLIALVLPSVVSAQSRSVAARTAPERDAEPSKLSLDDDDAGECGDDESSTEELIDCGSQLEARLDEPLAIAILRQTEVYTTKEQCQELLTDIWEQESCTAQGRECGKLLPGGVPSPAPKLVSSSASGQTVAAWLELDPAAATRLARPTDERMPKLRDLVPPVPPPKLVAR